MLAKLKTVHNSAVRSHNYVTFLSVCVSFNYNSKQSYVLKYSTVRPSGCVYIRCGDQALYIIYLNVKVISGHRGGHMEARCVYCDLNDVGQPQSRVRPPLSVAFVTHH